MELIEHHQQAVLEAFRRGEFDQIEIIGHADEKEFFELCLKEKMLEALAKAIPTARKKQEVPLWFQLAANLSLKLHLENAYQSLVAPAVFSVSYRQNKRLGVKEVRKMEAVLRAWRRFSRLFF